MNGASDEVISPQLADKELLGQFKAVEKLYQEDKHRIKTFIDAFLTKRQIQKLTLWKAPIAPSFLFTSDLVFSDFQQLQSKKVYTYFL
jgi:hypothetical protein